MEKKIKNESNWKIIEQANEIKVYLKKNSSPNYTRAIQAKKKRKNPEQTREKTSEIRKDVLY